MKILLVSIAFIGAIGCKTEATQSLRTPISRGTIRILAVVSEIKPVNTNASNIPCSNNPCEALIEIKQVIDTGAAFKGEIEEGQVIEAYFVKTLQPTKKIYPEMEQHLPGLGVGDEFQADVIYNVKSTETSGYHVITYIKR